MNTALVQYGEMELMAEAVAKSGLFGMKTRDQALALMIVAQAENRHPGSVATEYHIIQGRPALKADAMLARYQQAGGVVEWEEYTEAKVSARFHHPVNAPKPVLIEWTFAMAQKAGLTGKDNWKNYPRQMLRARVISEGVRTVFPAVAVGVYTPEEVGDFQEKEINPVQKRRERLPKPADHPQDVEDDAKLRSLETTSPGGAGAPPASAVARPPEPATGGVPITADQHIDLADKLKESGIKEERACKAWGVVRITELPADQYQRALAWVEKARK